MTRLEDVDQRDAEKHRDDRDTHRVDQRADPDAPQRAQVTHARHAERQGGKEQRHHQHEEQAQEDLPDWLGDVAREDVQPRRITKKEVGQSARGGAEDGADQDPGVKGHAHRGSIPACPGFVNRRGGASVVAERTSSGRVFVVE